MPTSKFGKNAISDCGWWFDLCHERICVEGVVFGGFFCCFWGAWNSLKEFRLLNPPWFLNWPGTLGYVKLFGGKTWLLPRFSKDCFYQLRFSKLIWDGLSMAKLFYWNRCDIFGFVPPSQLLRYQAKLCFLGWETNEPFSLTSSKPHGYDLHWFSCWEHVG